MISQLMRAGERLAGQRDVHLNQGLRLAVLEGLLSAAPYPLLYWLLDSLLNGSASTLSVIGLALAMLACLVLRIVVGAMGTPLIFTGAYAMMASARLRLVDHLQKLPLGWFGQNNSGEISARVTGDLALVEHLWSHFLGVFALSLAQLGFMLIFLFWLQPVLACAVLAMLPLACLAIYVAIRKTLVQAERMLASNNRTQAALQEYLQGIAVIRSFGRFGSALQRLNRVMDAQHRAMVSIELKPAPWVGLFGLMIEGGFILMVLLGCKLLLAGQLSIENLLLFSVLSLPLYRQAIDLGFSTLLLRFGHLALSRTEQLLEQQPMPEPAQPRKPQHFNIELKDVRFRYAERDATVIDGLSCHLPAGTLTALVGPSGAGKSTLAHLVARLWDIDSGELLIGGIEAREIGSDYLQEHISMVFQDVTLFSGTVLDNLLVGKPGASEQEVVHAARLARAHDFIEALPEGYATRIGEGGGWLSGGERQRLSIARALLKNSPILLLDEATSSVDPSSEAAIQQGLDALVRDRTVLVIAHRLHNIQHADQILVMDRGRIVERGCHDELLARDGLYARLWRQQSQARHWNLNT
ncbi:ABC transporter ATP-binding protein [Pseudomonas capsici]|uniref:ABC transporter ATP-binding protein/permease n=1 Tax=Pseudomonas capsici TaxID=2810614 RepID=A0ABT3BQM1_9PSED|nr:ABC transporter ATP-binding protein [Pseudomonas capsici]MCV4267104.1 ABC transporter ATP-binding protein/permease [Pseudomonas capsici]MCV4276272.1 ABC transporter ATP-binding protein/permease [Pseudomonas capsici]MCV4329996.1 ABC transporter ATP-binding protein/permease [Pseudomonas capsici]MCV4375152.1 ABC transporter ATP-binding protein/permease [Pseudomonas capsici]